MSTTMDKMQRRLLMILPLVFISVIAHFPTGLVLYWVTTNLWTVGQGLVTRRLVPRRQQPPPAAAPQARPSAPRARLQLRARETAPSRRLWRSRSRCSRPAPRRVKRRQGPRAVSAERTVEATGETVAEAKWNALRELELLVPALDKGAVASRCCRRESEGCSGLATRPPVWSRPRPRARRATRDPRPSWRERRRRASTGAARAPDRRDRGPLQDRARRGRIVADGDLFRG